MSKEICKKLSKHLSSLGMGYPQKEELIEILHENFTPLEAEVAPAIPAKVIPFEPVSVKRLYFTSRFQKSNLNRFYQTWPIGREPRGSHARIHKTF